MRVNRARIQPCQPTGPGTPRSPADMPSATQREHNGLASAPPEGASKLCRWLPVAVCPDSLTAGWYRRGVAPVGVDQPQCPAGAGDPGVDDAAVGGEVGLGGAVVGGGGVRQLP